MYCNGQYQGKNLNFQKLLFELFRSKKIGCYIMIGNIAFWFTSYEKSYKGIYVGFNQNNSK